jgi:Ran GTPase-activating protein (RanGAP) involved in mRNA processing and transport
MFRQLQDAKENKTDTINYAVQYISEVEANSIADALQDNISVKKLLLNLSVLQDAGLAIIHKALLTHPPMELIDISDTSLTDISVSLIASLIQRKIAKLINIRANEDISVENIDMLKKLALENGVKLITVTHKFKLVRENNTDVIDFLSTPFDFGNLAYLLCDVLNKNSSVKKLLFNGSQLCDEDLTALYEVLLQKKTLTMIDLSNNLLTDESIPFLIQLINSNQRLTLNVSGNMFSGEEINKLLKAAVVSANIKLITKPEDSPKLRRTFLDKTDAGSMSKRSHSEGDLSVGNQRRIGITTGPIKGKG